MVAAAMVDRAPIRWTAGTSPEPFVAMLVTGIGGETTVSVNERLATLPGHHALVGRWAACHRGETFALLAEAALRTV